MRAQIILFRRMPPNISYFDYLVPENLQKKIKPGQLVKVPFRNKEEFGLVYSLEQDSLKLKSSIKLRTLNSICFENSFLTKQISDFYKELSEFYATDLGFIYKFSFPAFTKKFFNELSPTDFPEIYSIVKNTKPTVITTSDIETVSSFILKQLSPKKQNLILVPEKNSLDEIASILKNKFPIELLSSDITDKNSAKLWKKIRQNENLTIVGTRKALFLPWTNLQKILILDEGNENYKSWDMAPRYHTKDAAMLLSKFTGAQVYLLSHTPSISSYHFAQQSSYLSSGNLTPLNRAFTLVDLNLEKQAKNYSPLSYQLIDLLQGLQPSDSAFLYINKKGSAGYLFCGDCKKPVICNICGRPVSYFGVKKEIRCNFCQTNKPLIGQCLNCHSYNLKMRNPGTESVEKELSKLPELSKFKIIRIDSENEMAGDLKSNNSGTIFVGTELAWSIIPWQNIKLLGFLDTDRSLLSSEYKNLENLWQKIRDSFYKTSPHTTVVLQTSHPDHYLFSALKEPDIFYQNQLKERSFFQYPPFNYWLKLAIFSPNANLAIKEAGILKNRLEDLTKTVKNAKISGPHQAIPYFQKGNYRYILLVRLGYENYHTVIKEINKIIPKNWKVDPNPSTLFSV